MQYVAKRSVLVRQDEKDGKMIDVRTKEGQKIELTDRDAVKIWGALEIPEKDQKRLLSASKVNGYKRRI